MYKSKANIGKSRKLVFYLSVLCIIMLLLSYVGMQMLILSFEENVRDIRKERAALEEEIKVLETKIAELWKVSRIKKIAVEELGMDFPYGAPEMLYFGID